MVCLALELVGPWVVLGFSLGMEEFDKTFSSENLFFSKGGWSGATLQKSIR